MAIGNEVIAYGNSSLAVNYKTEATDICAFASGSETKASGVASASFNSKTQAWGNAAIATGSNTIAGAPNSATFGVNTKTENNANYSFAGGLGSVSGGIGNFVFGEYPLVNSQYGITVASFGDSVELTVERPRDNGTEIIFASLDDIPTIFKSEYTLYWKFINETSYRKLVYATSNDGLTFYLYHASEPVNIAWNKIIITA
jgi:hypothetical protein